MLEWAERARRVQSNHLVDVVGAESAIEAGGAGAVEAIHQIMAGGAVRALT